MIDSKYVTILRFFSKQELNEFEKWLNSPWCTSNKSLSQLFAALKKYHPKYLIRDDDETFFLNTFPKKLYSYHAFRNLLSQSYQQVELFLAHQKLESNQTVKKILLSSDFRKRKMEDRFYKNLKVEIDKIEDFETKTCDDYQNLFNLYKIGYREPTNNPYIDSKSGIGAMDKNLDILYLLEKGAIITDKYFRSKILKTEYYELSADISAWKLIAEKVDHPSINLYKKRFTETYRDSVPEFLSAYEYLNQNFEKLNPNCKRIHILYLLNDTKHFRRLNQVDLNKMLSLYKLGLSSKSLIFNGKITQMTYNSVITISNTCYDFEYSDYVIENYTQYLPKEMQLDSKVWAIAHKELKSGNFKKSVEALLDYEFNNRFFQKNSKSLLLQAYFELFLESDSYYSFLLSYCDSFERWIQRDKTSSKTNIESYTRFIQMTRLMAKAYISPEFHRENFIEFFEGRKNSHARAWLQIKHTQILELKK